MENLLIPFLMGEYKWQYGEGYFGPDSITIDNVQRNMDGHVLNFLLRKRDYSVEVGKPTADQDSLNNNAAANFITFLRPEVILPKLTDQGAGTDKLIGNKFRWKNTLIRLEYDNWFGNWLQVCQSVSVPKLTVTDTFDSYLNAEPQRFGVTTRTQDKAVTLNSDNSVNTDEHWLAAGWFNNNSGIQDLKIPAVRSGTQVIDTYKARTAPLDLTDAEYNTFKANPNSYKTGAVALEATNTIITQVQPSVLVYPIENGSMQNPSAYKLRTTPMYMHPRHEFFYYVRIMIFKFNMSYSDWNQLSTVQNSAAFLNCLWWNRKGASGAFNASIRDPDLAIPNPFAKTFSIYYNKLKKITPWRNYNFDINMKSRNSKGDLITIKTNGPYLTQRTYDLYENACYIGFILPPRNVDTDFDFVTASIIRDSSPWEVSKNNTVNPDWSRYNQTAVTTPFDAPYDIVKQVHGDFYTYWGQALQLGQWTARTRTCFFD